VNAILGSVKGVSRDDVAAATGASKQHLQSGSNRWDRWMGVHLDEEGHGERCLQDLSTHVHGNSWPVEWVNFITEMWEDERVTRKGESLKDYC
jgi:hypothetical protein